MKAHVFLGQRHMPTYRYERVARCKRSNIPHASTAHERGQHHTHRWFPKHRPTSVGDEHAWHTEDHRRTAQQEPFTKDMLWYEIPHTFPFDPSSIAGASSLTCFLPPSVQKFNRLGMQFGHIPGLPCVILPRSGPLPPINKHPTVLVQVFRNDLRLYVEYHHVSSGNRSPLGRSGKRVSRTLSERGCLGHRSRQGRRCARTHRRRTLRRWP